MRIRRWVLTLCVIAMVQSVPLAWSQQGSIWRARADVTVGQIVTQIAPANAARITLLCANTSTSITIRLGDTSVSPTRGVPLTAQSIISFTGTSAIHGITVAGTADVACSEEVR